MTPRTRHIVSRRERPAKPALTREGIVATAVEVMQAEGLDRVTMRRIAQELDTGAASLYVYVRNTTELHAAMLEELLGQVDLVQVRKLKETADRDLTVGGRRLAAQAIAAGLVDEYQLFLVPAVVGSGTRALPDQIRLNLALAEERRFGNGTVYLYPV
jgi:AcrR family transcriptional regulator